MVDAALLVAVFLLAAADDSGLAREPGLVAHWPFERTSGSIVSDVAGKHHGRIELAERAPGGRRGQGLRFDGERSLVYLFRYADLEPRTGDFSVELWCWSGKLTATAILAHKMSPFAGGNAGWYLSLQKDGTLHIRLTETPERQVMAQTAVPVVRFEQWNHVAAVRQGNTVRLYANGKRVAEGVGPLGLDVGCYGDIVVGSLWGNKYRGLIDEIVYYNTALDDGQVSERFATLGTPR